MRYLYGLHMMLDGPIEAVPSQETAERIIMQAVALAHMTVIAGPFYQRDGPHASCVAILAESHCLLHAITLRDGVYCFFDLYSCRRFLPAPIIAMLKEQLRMTPRDYRLLRRTDAQDTAAALWRMPVGA